MPGDEMMLDKNACSDNNLQHLLTGHESSDQYQSALRHVDDCSSCQIQLEKLAAGVALWQETQSVLSSDATSEQNESDTPRHDSSSVSPFTDVQFDGEKIVVTYNAEDHQWLELDGIKVEDIVASSKAQFGNLWQKRIGEDLVEVLEGMQHRPDDTVTLRLLNLETNQEVEVAEAKMSAENRSVIYQTRRQAEDN